MFSDLCQSIAVNNSKCSKNLRHLPPHCMCSIVCSLVFWLHAHDYCWFRSQFSVQNWRTKTIFIRHIDPWLRGEAAAALTHGHTRITTSTHHHGHSIHPHTGNTGMNRPVHKAPSTMTMIYQAHPARQPTFWQQATVWPHVSTPHHSNSMESEIPTGWQTCWHDSSPWASIHGLVELEFTCLSKWQIHIACVCPQHQRIHFLSSPFHQTTRRTHGSWWHSSSLLWPTGHHHHRPRPKPAEKDQNSPFGQRHHGLLPPVCQHQPSRCTCQDSSAGTRTARTTSSTTTSPTAPSRAISAP